MAKKDIIRSVGYLILIWVGYIVGEYPHIPSFTLGFIKHTQPSMEVYDKMLSITLFLVYATMMMLLWNNKWARISLIFITWGMFYNMVDELTNESEIFTLTEKISLLFAILTTSFLIWKHRQK